MENMLIDPFTKFDKDWALVTGGTKEKFNSMTVSWGGMGTLWSKPVVTLYVRPERYTCGFLMENDIFTVSFYDEKYRKALILMGSASGRDINKAEAAGLTPLFLENGITYKEAERTLVCRKIYTQQLDMSSFPKDAFRYYEEGAKPHFMFIGEVIG